MHNDMHVFKTVDGLANTLFFKGHSLHKVHEALFLYITPGVAAMATVIPAILCLEVGVTAKTAR